MIRSLFTAASGLSAQQANVDVISNNLSNVNTTGFKRFRANFEDLFYQQLRAVGTNSDQNTLTPSGIQVGLGTRVASTQMVHNQGSLQSTERELDIAIEGRGFLRVTLPDGTNAYTRAGNLSLDANGTIVTTSGFPLEGNFTIGTDHANISIGADGLIQYTVPGNPAPQGNFQLTTSTFLNPEGLETIGGNLFLETSSSGTPTTGNPGDSGRGLIRQAFLEGSNVDLARELVNLIIGQRAYEVNSRAIEASDEMLQTLVNLR